MNYSDLIMGHFVIDTDAIYREIEVFLDDDINRIAVDCGIRVLLGHYFLWEDLRSNSLN